MNNQQLEALKPLFPKVPDEAWPKLETWAALLREWNQKINLISRKNVDELEMRHLAHSLVITHKLQLMNGARILDVGTGGGIPGLPMAICYPQAQFTLVDSIGKKIKVVRDIADRLDLKNVTAEHKRIEEIKTQFDFVTGRGVTALPVFISWIHQRFRPGKKHSLENGLIYWKGGDLEPEIARSGIKPKATFPINDYIQDEYFEEKYIAYFRAKDLGPPVKKLKQIIASQQAQLKHKK